MANKTCGECMYRYTEIVGKCRIWKHIEISPDRRFCGEFEPSFESKPTNGDKIRQMSNDELAELFALSCMCDGCPLKYVECIGDGETARTYAHCYDKFISYLNAPAESEGKEDE